MSSSTVAPFSFGDFVHPVFGVFRSSIDVDTGEFISFVDRIGDEFRGGIAFLKVRFPSLPSTVWDNLATVVRSYKTQDGKTVNNLAAFDGSAFQVFWPSLRNNEQDFMGFRNVLYNAFVAHSDFSSAYRLPGFLSAAETPDNHEYVGDLGVREIAEWPFSDPTNGLLLMDTGSTYALASAYAVAPEQTLRWLKAVGEMPGMKGTYGLLDSARSSSEIAKRWLGIDLASTVIGLNSAGPDAFDTYLRNRGLELSYNLLYDSKSNLGINKTSASIALPPEFADRSFGVLRNSHITSINDFHLTNEADNGFRAGAHFKFGTLTGGYGGVVFHMSAPYNATSSQLVLQYSVKDNPGLIKIELQDTGGQAVYTTFVNLSNQTNPRAVQKLVLNLPNNTSLSNIDKVVMIMEQGQSGGDTSGEFIAHSLNFLHLPSSQNLNPDPSLKSSDVTVLNNNPPAQLFSSSQNSSLDRLSSSLSRLNYDVTNHGFAGITINFDPQNNSNGADLSSLNSIVFGLDSSKVKKVKIEVDDASGKRAVFYAAGINTTRSYYQLLTSLMASSLDLTKVKRINFVVDETSVNSGDQVGNINLELGGLLFP